LKLPAHYGRGFDDLPDRLRDIAAPALVRSVDRAELLRALRKVADLLLAEGAAASACPLQLAERLREFMSMD
jgi:hypothetical protein